mmetsp:Transcript_53299/g.127517  ORF Transcript_53299/g.127517 Transcript_53299/m.127517 type:complete len:212 (+) Transcript_53299:821-1456(+)
MAARPAVRPGHQNRLRSLAGSSDSDPQVQAERLQGVQGQRLGVQLRPPAGRGQGLAQHLGRPGKAGRGKETRGEGPPREPNGGRARDGTGLGSQPESQPRTYGLGAGARAGAGPRGLQLFRRSFRGGDDVAVHAVHAVPRDPTTRLLPRLELHRVHRGIRRALRARARRGLGLRGDHALCIPAGLPGRARHDSTASNPGREGVGHLDGSLQ